MRTINRWVLMRTQSIGIDENNQSIGIDENTIDR